MANSSGLAASGPSGGPDTTTEPQPGAGTLGTFAGVFTPSILTILGIILFLRMGYVVGAAGLGRALIIIFLANLISVLTSVSLAAVATNLKVKGGGDYYLISRTLGVEFGGAIGFVLFLAQSVSIGFYCIGFGEAVSAILPQATRAALLSPQLIAAAAIGFLFILAWLGADWATKFQYGVMTLLVLALISFFVGGLSQWDMATFQANWQAPSPSIAGGAGFWILFAVFFPAVTGFTQGVSMSGDLKDPGKSLPLGTFAAVFLSIVVYFCVAFVFAGALPAAVLAADYTAMKQTAAVGLLIDAGVIAATLSSAMASFLGAPRIMQSMAADRIFPVLTPLAKQYGPANNPRRAVVLAGAIACLTISFGNLNLIASVVSMFFLISYGLLNYATYFEARGQAPSFRPRFKWFHQNYSLVGWLACLGVMLAIDLSIGIVAIAILFAIYQYLQRTAGPARWADSRRSYYLQQVRKNLYLAAGEPGHDRDWRPGILAFSHDSERRAALLRVGAWLGNTGFLTAVNILEGEGPRMLKLKEEAEAQLQKDIVALNIDAFQLVMVTANPQEGLQSLVQSFGIGPLKANTVLLNWLDNLPRGVLGVKEMRYTNNLRTAFRLGCNVVVMHADSQSWQSEELAASRIDVWWSDDATGHLMLLFAYLLTRNETWQGATIRVLEICPTADSDIDPSKHPETAKNDTASPFPKKSLAQYLQDARIEADIKTIVSDQIASPHVGACAGLSGDLIAAESKDASLVFLPFYFQSGKMACVAEETVDSLLEYLPPTALVLAAEDIDLDAEPEEGEAGEQAEAQDAVAEAKKVADRARKDARKVQDETWEKIQKVEAAIGSDMNEADIVKVVSDAMQAIGEEEKAERRAAKKTAKAEMAEEELNKGVEQGNPE